MLDLLFYALHVWLGPMELPLFLRQYFVSLHQLLGAMFEFLLVFLRLGYYFKCSFLNFLLKFNCPRHLLIDLSNKLERLTSQFHILPSKFIQPWKIYRISILLYIGVLYLIWAESVVRVHFSNTKWLFLIVAISQGTVSRSRLHKLGLLWCLAVRGWRLSRWYLWVLDTTSVAIVLHIGSCQLISTLHLHGHKSCLLLMGGILLELHRVLVHRHLEHGLGDWDVALILAVLTAELGSTSHLALLLQIT